MRSAEGGGFVHEGLAVACARRFAGRGVAMEDLLQEARAAICLAASRFDPDRGVHFSTYAVPVTLGALRECCRRAAPMHVPRREQMLLMAGDSLLNGVRSEETPPAESFPRSLRPAESRLVQMLASIRRMQAVTADPEEVMQARESSFEERVLLRDAIRQLGMPYAQVIGLRYFCGLSQREVGCRLNVAQWQVCRWEKVGLGRLRELWSDTDERNG